MFKRRKRRKQKGGPTAELTPDQYQAMIEQAEELQKKGELQKALALLEEALAAAPRHFKSQDKSALWHKIADLYVKLGDFHRAAIYLRRFLKWHPDSPDYRDVVLKLIDLYWLKDDKLTQIVNLLEQLREKNSDDWASRLQLHSIYAAWPNFSHLAAQVAQELNLLAESKVDKLKELAAHYLYQSDLANATDAAMSALAKAPTDVAICELLFQIKVSQDQDQEAIKWAERMIALDKTRISSYQQLASLYQQLGHIDQAHALLERAVSIALYQEQYDQACQLQTQIATLYLLNEAYSQAQNAICLALAWSPTDLPALQSLLGIYQAQKNWLGAIELVQKHFVGHEMIDKSYVLDLLGLLCLQTEQIDQAIEIFKGLVKFDSQAIETRYHLALAYEKKRKYRMAQQEVNRVLRRQNHHQGARELYDRLSGRKKRRSKERRQQNKAKNPVNKPFKALKVEDFLKALEIDEEVNKLVQYLTDRYWKMRDGRGQNPKISFRSLVLVMVVQGINISNCHNYTESFKRKKKRGYVWLSDLGVVWINYQLIKH